MVLVKYGSDNAAVAESVQLIGLSKTNTIQSYVEISVVLKYKNIFFSWLYNV